MNIPENDAEFDPFANDPVTKKSNGSSGGGGAGIAWLALLVGLAAVTINAYQWWQGQSEEPVEQVRQSAIDTMSQTQAGFSQALESLRGRVAAEEGKDDSGSLAAIRSDINAMQARLSESGLDASGDHALIEAVQLTLQDLAQRIADLESSVAALAIRGDSPEKGMDLAEVDYLLRLAGERLALFGDVASADIALGLADSQLQAVNDPLYLGVRRKIDESRTALKQIPVLDLVHIAGEIAALQSAIPGLPFPGETPVVVLVEDQPDAGLWQKIKNALKPLVKVRRRVDESLELSLDDKDFMRQGLWLQLESARLALMRKDSQAWDSSLARATNNLGNRFDPTNAAVRNALEGLDKLAQINLVQEFPDISAAWRQLRLLREGKVRSDSGVERPEVTETQADSVPEDPISEDPIPDDHGAEG